MKMKLALICFSVLTSLSISFASQEKQPIVCRGKSLPLLSIPGPKMTGPARPLRFGGTREVGSPYFYSFPTDKAFTLVIRNRDEFSSFWKRLTAPVPKGDWLPEPPEIDFSKEIMVVSAMGTRPSSGYGTMIDGACEVDGQIEVFISNLETPCGAALTVLTAPADAVRIPRTDLPVVFRETQITCNEMNSHLIGVHP